MRKFIGLLFLGVGLAALAYGLWELGTVLLRVLDHDGLSGHKSWGLLLRGVLAIGLAVAVLPTAARWMRD